MVIKHVLEPEKARIFNLQFNMNEIMHKAVMCERSGNDVKDLAMICERSGDDLRKIWR